MAHDLECKQCGWVEAAHDFPQDYEGVCRMYQSPNPAWELAEWKRLREPEDAQHTDAVWMLTPFGPIDIGS